MLRHVLRLFLDIFFPGPVEMKSFYTALALFGPVQAGLRFGCSSLVSIYSEKTYNYIITLANKRVRLRSVLIPSLSLATGPLHMFITLLAETPSTQPWRVTLVRGLLALLVKCRRTSRTTGRLCCISSIPPTDRTNVYPLSTTLPWPAVLLVG